MYDVVAIGELLIDFAPLSSDEDGYPTIKANPGGAPGNFLATLSKYGAKTAMLGKVGDDFFGRKLIATMKKANIETKGIVVDKEFFTTLAFVTLDENGDRSFSFARKPGADTQLEWGEVNRDLIENSKYFHFGTLSLTCDPIKNATRKCIEYAKILEKTVTFDPNLRLPLWDDEESAKEQMLWGLTKADIVKISDNEVDFLWSCSPEEGADIMLDDYNVSLAMVTLGKDGCYLKNKNGSCHVPVYSVKTIDTTGAGDIFGGSALSYLIKQNKNAGELTEEELIHMARFASAASSISTSVVGGIPSIPDEATVEKVASAL